MSTIQGIIDRHKNNKYVMSCYATRDELYTQMRKDIGELVEIIDGAYQEGMLDCDEID